MTEWYIKVDDAGNATGHVAANSVLNPLTSASSDKAWYKPATMTKPTPGPNQKLTGPVYDVDAGTITYSTVNVPVTAGQVQAECARRLALGFDHDFGDARGVHTFATTDKDMEGWREVTDAASALFQKGDLVTTIEILTETGPCNVNCLEWADVRLAAAAFRQPIWAASFALQSQYPIPTDFEDDSHWTS